MKKQARTTPWDFAGCRASPATDWQSSPTHEGLSSSAHDRDAFSVRCGCLGVCLFMGELDPRGWEATLMGAGKAMMLESRKVAVFFAFQGDYLKRIFHLSVRIHVKVCCIP